jgi:hypothetical protein
MHSVKQMKMAVANRGCSETIYLNRDAITWQVKVISRELPLDKVSVGAYHLVQSLSPVLMYSSHCVRTGLIRQLPNSLCNSSIVSNCSSLSSILKSPNRKKSHGLIQGYGEVGKHDNFENSSQFRLTDEVQHGQNALSVLENV